MFSSEFSSESYPISAAIVVLATNLPLGSYPMSLEAANDQLNVVRTTGQLVAQSIGQEMRNWRQKSLMRRFGDPIIGMFSWANLAFGESIAIGLQGVAQATSASAASSFMVGVGTALIVEIAFTFPLALRNKVKQSVETVVEAAAEAFWLGAAMGVEDKKLPLSQAPFAIGAYMIFGTALAAAAEYNNLAQQALEHTSTIMPLLIGWAILKKLNTYFEYQTWSDHLANNTVRFARKLFDR